MLRGAVDAFFGCGDLCRPDPPAYDRLSEVGVPATLILGDRNHPGVIDCCDSAGRGGAPAAGGRFRVVGPEALPAGGSTVACSGSPDVGFELASGSKRRTYGRLSAVMTTDGQARTARPELTSEGSL
jgi:hypothetical protein